MFLRGIGNADPSSEFPSLCDSLNSNQVECDCRSDLFRHDSVTFEPYQPLRSQIKKSRFRVLYRVELSGCNLFVVLKNQAAFHCLRSRYLRLCLTITTPRSDSLFFLLESLSNAACL